MENGKKNFRAKGERGGIKARAGRRKMRVLTHLFGKKGEGYNPVERGGVSTHRKKILPVGRSQGGGKR